MSKVARKTRVVSARELSRRMSVLLDEMAAEEMALIVLRYGRPTALFVPFEENAVAPTMPRVADIDGLTAPEPEEDLDDVVLDPIHERILLDMLGCTDLAWRIGRMEHEKPIHAVHAALTRLELADLIEGRFAGSFELTRKGSRVARRLDSTA